MLASVGRESLRERPKEALINHADGGKLALLEVAPMDGDLSPETSVRNG